jgi:hypothetical protein
VTFDPDALFQQPHASWKVELPTSGVDAEGMLCVWNNGCASDV